MILQRQKATQLYACQRIKTNIGTTSVHAFSAGCCKPQPALNSRDALSSPTTRQNDKTQYHDSRLNANHTSFQPTIQIQIRNGRWKGYARLILKPTRRLALAKIDVFPRLTRSSVGKTGGKTGGKAGGDSTGKTQSRTLRRLVSRYVCDAILSRWDGNA